VAGTVLRAKLLSQRSASGAGFRQARAAYDIPAFAPLSLAKCEVSSKAALNTPGPALMDMRVKREENVFPLFRQVAL
jgi:thiamine pyrophosphate-dependent acetolactate synthase large subunit-like protein